MKTLPRTVWEVLKFEAVCKLLAVCLVYPLLSGVFRIYATSEGLHFNGGLIPAFLSPAGIVVVVFVALGATAFVYWEISTVIRIAALTRQAVPFTWREVWWGYHCLCLGCSASACGRCAPSVMSTACCPPLHCLNLFMGNCAATGNWAWRS